MVNECKSQVKPPSRTDLALQKVGTHDAVGRAASAEVYSRDLLVLVPTAASAGAR